VRCAASFGRTVDRAASSGPGKVLGSPVLRGGVWSVERLGRFGRLGSQAIGLDVDRGALKAVQVSKSAGSYVLRHVGYHRLPPGAIREGEVADSDLLAAEIREFWSSHSFTGKSVILGVASQRVVVRLLDFPHMEEEDLRSAITFEAQDHIPMSLDEAILDYVVLGPPSEGSDLDRILIVAAHRDMIGAYTSAVRAGGLRAAGIDVKALCLTRSTLPDTFFDEGDTLLMDVGTELTNLVIMQGGNPTLTRFIPLGMNRLVEAVASAADLPEEEAEKQALNPQARLGYEPESTEERSEESSEEDDDFDPALVYDVRRGLEEAIQTLAEDVQRSIEYHHSQPESREVSQVFVSGEGALVAGFDAYLGELLGIPTHRGNPVGRLAANRSNVSDEQLAAMEPVLAVAIGLAMEDDE
jgi:type IV pilus assembly protein PilM